MTSYLEVMENRLVKNRNAKHLVGESMTLADIDQVHIAYSYLLNEKNKYYKEQKEVVEKYPYMNDYYQSLREEFKDYLDARP